MEKIIENAKAAFDKDGVFVAEKLLSNEQVSKLREGFLASREYCAKLQKKYELDAQQTDTVHHVLFMHEIFQEVLDNPDYMAIVETFFGGSKFVLNSIGGQNNRGDANYASNIHRDVRFYTQDRLMLNTILIIDDFTDTNGPTEFLLGSDKVKDKPSEESFSEKAVSLTCPAGSIIFFDSRIWHRAGKRKIIGDDRIIFTPIFARSFIKPGFDYSKALQAYGLEKVSDNIKQLCSYYSDIPASHDEWYNLKERRCYLAGQDD
ncbi:phytanoyl-CoA dioxygenase family protein [Kiloniella litopenaei]|uniref:phytanoyl-CoA dioxygenase family protein n=1 Tax=Kiloniella litopenaei TaxID=1549748 RepID=UPI0006971BB4|nr:phytanoyl-CoA dioxygenase family protein [Kiloniella litopenaei]